MKNRYLLLPISLILLCASHVFAADDALPPPTEVKAEAVDTSADAVTESAPNLRDELKAPDSDKGVDVRFYKRSDGAEITEYAVRGRVFKIKVQPAGDLPAYYLYDQDGDGTFEQRLPGGGKRISPPTWVLQEF